MYTFINVNSDEVDKILNYYVTIHDKKFSFCSINCEIVMDLDNNSTTNIETNYLKKLDSDNRKSYLIYYIDCFK